MVNKIYIVRHGVTNCSKIPKTPIQNRDLELNIEGIQQIVSVGKYLKDCENNTIYTDESKRTIESSQIIAEQLNEMPKIVIDNRLSNKDINNNYKCNIRRLFNQVIQDKNDVNICWVTHGRIIKLIYYYIQNNGFPENIPKLTWCDYGCISCIEVKDKKIQPIYFGK